MNNPIVQGSISSRELAPQQLRLATVIEYYAKIAVYVSAEQMTVRVEQPDGLPRFLKEKEKMEKSQNRKLTEDEIESLENEYRYDVRNIPIGNASTLLSRLLMELFSSEKVRKELDASIDDALKISNKVMANIMATKTIPTSELL